MASEPLIQNAPGTENSSTPILDCLQAPPGPRRFSRGKDLSLIQIVGVLFGLFGILVCIFLAMDFSPTLSRILDDPWGAMMTRIYPDAKALMALLIPVLALYLAIGIHEFGHLCAGWIAGFEFGRLSIGPIFLCRVGKQLKAGFQRSLLNGRVIMFPRSLNQLRWRFLIFIAGGPLANFVGFLWLVWIAASVSSVSAGAELLFTLSAWISLILGISNLFPFETGDLVSDGGRIGMLLSKDGRKERWFALTAIENALRNLQRESKSGRLYSFETPLPSMIVQRTLFGPVIMPSFGLAA